MKSLLFILIAAVIAAAVVWYFSHKLSLASKGHKLDYSEDDSVTVSEDELQDFMFEMEETAAKEETPRTEKPQFGGRYAAA